MIKVLHLLDTCARGGAETLLLDICNNFDQNELDLYFCTFRGGELEKDFLASKVKSMKMSRKYPIDFMTIYKLRKFISDEKIEVIHTHILVDTIHTYFAVIGLQVKLVHTYHGYDFNYDLKNRLLLKYLISKTDTNIYVSNVLKNYYMTKFLPTNTNTVVYNGVDASKIKHANMVDIKSELSLPTASKVYGMVGNFVNTGRDQLFLCKSFKKIIQKDNSYHLIFVGRKSEKSPEFYEECYEYCSKNNLLTNIHFLGARADAIGIMKSFDGYVYASNHDTFGLTIVEAMHIGIPVFVNDLDVFKEIIKENDLVTLYQTKNVHDFIDKFLKNDLSTILKNQDIENMYTIQQTINEYINSYQEIV
jgi:glycosyltransferase involved in cell wall biosynthesis